MTEYTNGGRARAYEALRESEELHTRHTRQPFRRRFPHRRFRPFTFICPNVDVLFGYVPDEVQAMGVIHRLLGDNLFDLAELQAASEVETSSAKSPQSLAIAARF